MTLVDFAELTSSDPTPTLLLTAQGGFVAANAAARRLLAAPLPSSIAAIAVDPDRALAYVRDCSGTADALPGNLSLATATGPAGFRCTGAALRARSDSGDRLIVLRLAPASVHEGFAQLTDHINRLNAEIHARREIESTLRESEKRFRTLADNIPTLCWMADASGWIYWYNNRWYEYTGTTPEQMEGWGWQAVHDPQSLPLVLTRWKASIAAGEPFEMTFPLRGFDGRFRPFLTRIVPLRNESGAVVQWFGVNTDVTEQQQAQRRLRLLIDELNHRVKNTLATVQSIVAQCVRGMSTREELRHSIESRLFALSRSHDLLTREHWEGASLGDVLHQTIDAFSAAPGHAERFVVEGSEIRLRPNQALALGIAFHELATNAAKYGALSNGTGKVLVTWQASDGKLRLRWEEHDGPPVVAPSRRGFGSRVLAQGIARELKGTAELAYSPTGLVWQLEFQERKDESA